MALGKVSIWQLTPEQAKTYVPGMKLGRPDRVVSASKIMQPVTEVAKAKALERSRRGSRTRDRERTILTAELYEAELLLGLTDKQIAETYGIQLSTITHYKSLWRQRGDLK